MKKKAIIVLMLLAALPLMLFAKTADITIGGFAQLNGSLGEVVSLIEDNNIDPLLKVEHYQFGGEARFRLLMLEADTGLFINESKYAKEGDSFFKKLDYGGFANVGLAFNLLGFIRIGVGAGTTFIYAPSLDNLFYIGHMSASRLDKLNGMEGGMSFENMLKTAPVQLRATVNLMLGPVMLGVAGTLDTSVTFESFSDGDKLKKGLEDSTLDWRNIKCGLFLGFIL